MIVPGVLEAPLPVPLPRPPLQLPLPLTGLALLLRDQVLKLVALNLFVVLPALQPSPESAGVSARPVLLAAEDLRVHHPLVRLLRHPLSLLLSVQFRALPVLALPLEPLLLQPHLLLQLVAVVGVLVPPRTGTPDGAADATGRSSAAAAPSVAVARGPGTPLAAPLTGPRPL